MEGDTFEALHSKHSNEQTIANSNNFTRNARGSSFHIHYFVHRAILTIWYMDKIDTISGNAEKIGNN